MEKNVGGLDRTGRTVIGLVLLVAGLAAVAGLWAGTTVGAVALVVGAVLFVTGTTQTCPIYQVAGVDTCERN